MSKKGRKKSHRDDIEVVIPERTQILEFLRAAGRPRNLDHIALHFETARPRERKALNKRLEAMLRDGEVIRNRRQGYGLTERMDLVAGTVIGHQDGYGFLRPDQDGEDLFLPVREMRALLHGDRALVRRSGTDRRGRSEGALVEILDRANRQVAGRYYRDRKLGYVVPDNKRLHQDILIPADERGLARNGQFVVAEITRQPDQHTQPVGRVIEVIEGTTEETATELAIRAHNIPYLWPRAVERQVEAIDQRIDKTRRREDLRDLPLVTIDGEDARDFDDAVYCERDGSDWRLLVAIADVSWYVRPGTPLDQEAALRGTSVYFPRRVVPMLPEILSNELCSLKPDVPRLCLACELRFDRHGEMRGARFFEGIMCSAARLSYTETAAVIQHGEKPRKGIARLVPHLHDMHDLYRLLHGRRREAGLLDFRAVESRLIFDSKGDVSEINALVRNDAHRLIEEFMLAANTAAAGFLLERKLPTLYRNHEPPVTEKLGDLREFLGGFGLSLGGGENPRTADFAALLDSVQARDDAHLIETVLLRSMQLAVYREKNMGHFGLAFPAYTHFTSPIRRYPDLLVHRAIRHCIDPAFEYAYSLSDMQHLGESCSHSERRAEEASRDVMQRLKCEFMRDKVGAEYPGTVSAVTAFGLFVELDELYVEGLVHVTSLPNDYYHHDPIQRRLTGERTGRTFRLADRIVVQVVRVNVEDKQIDFTLVDAHR